VRLSVERAGCRFIYGRKIGPKNFVIYGQIFVPMAFPTFVLAMLADEIGEPCPCCLAIVGFFFEPEGDDVAVRRSWVCRGNFPLRLPDELSEFFECSDWNSLRYNFTSQRTPPVCLLVRGVPVLEHRRVPFIPIVYNNIHIYSRGNWLLRERASLYCEDATKRSNCRRTSWR
jgi:hypothetical protein